MADRKPMGIGVVGQPNITLKTQFRFTFEIFGFCNNQKNVIPEHFVRVASRPNISIQEIEVHHLNGKTWFPGKASLETMTVTYIDVAHEQSMMLWNWLATVYDITNPITLTMGNKRDWSATGVLSMYDGCGTLLEQFQLQHMFPTSVNFGPVDYQSNEVSTIDLTLRYSDIIYRSYCPAFVPTSCCTGCGTTTQSNPFTR